MDWTLILGVTAGVTACVGAWGWAKAWAYRRWWRDSTAQLVIVRRTNGTLRARIRTYRDAAVRQLDAEPWLPTVDGLYLQYPGAAPRPVSADELADATPDDQGGATPYPGQGA